MDGLSRERGWQSVILSQEKIAPRPALPSRCVTHTILPCHHVKHDDYCPCMAIPCVVLMFHASIVASCWKSAGLCGTQQSIMYIVTSCLSFHLVLAVLRGWGEGVSTLRGWIYSID